jgi:hypothetical protein
MAKAAKQNSTTGTAPDPIFAAIENHKKLDHAWLAFAAELDEKQIGAKKNGKRTSLWPCATNLSVRRLQN